MNIINKITFEKFAFFLTLIFTFYVSKIFYNSYYSPDIEKYIIYLDYFTKNGPSPALDQGVLYFFIVSIFLNFNKYLINPSNYEIIYSYSIQDANMFLYLVGILGLYKVLKTYNYKDREIYLALSIINLTPILFAIRSTMKPEILGFSLLTWLIYFVKKYKTLKKPSYLFKSLPIICLIFTSKGSMLGMIGLFLFLYFLDELLNLFKTNRYLLIILILSLVVLLIPIYFENYNINNLNVLDYQPPEQYQNNAPVDIIYNFDLKEFINQPTRNNHASSFIAITLLDTFGDYFQLYWEYEYSLTNTSRKSLFLTGDFSIDYDRKEISIPIDNRFLNLEYYRIFISVILAILFYFSVAKKIISKLDKDKKIIIISPIISALLLLIQVISGFPAQNWDPSKGDTLKPYYYSFFLLISISFLLVEYLKKKNFIFKFSMLIILFITHIFLIGFPKANNSSFDNEVIYRNNHLVTCELNNLIFSQTLFEKENINCLSNEEVFCASELFKKNEQIMVKDSSILQVKDPERCKDLYQLGYQYVDTKISVSKTPIVSVVYFGIFLLTIFKSMFKKLSFFKK